jgi:hypothetical protein
MTKERIKDIARSIYESVRSDCWGTTQTMTESALMALPEFQEPKWIKCSEQMPESGTMIYVVFKHGGSRQVLPSVYCDDGLKSFSGFARRLSTDEVTHWMPRNDPALPEEEESELVRILRTAMRTAKESQHTAFYNGWNDAFEFAIKEVKQNEKEKK